MAKAKSEALWGGRFKAGAADRLRDYTESVSFDWNLYRHDIAGSMAHAKMLGKIGVLKKTELADILKGLGEILDEIEAGKFKWSRDCGDVHMNIEAELTRRYPAGAKLHTGRSRNDQVATAMRLWLKDEIVENRKAVAALQAALVGWAEHDVAVVIPGYTHLQRAQPVLLAHHLLAYVEMLARATAGWPTRRSGPTSCRSAPAPSRAVRCRSTGPMSPNCSASRACRRIRWTR